MTNHDGRELLNKADKVEQVELALREWGTLLSGKTGYVPPGRSNTTYHDVPDKAKYVTEADREATHKLFSLIASNAKLLRSLLSEYGCHEYIHPMITSMLDLTADVWTGKNMGGWWSRACDYAGTHLWGGPCSVPDELHKWVVQLKGEAANAQLAAGEGPASSATGKSKNTGRPSHRPPKRDRKADAKLVADWKSSGMTRAEFERKRGIAEGAVIRAQDSVRKPPTDSADTE